jgi:hypothetical protein
VPFRKLCTVEWATLLVNRENQAWSIAEASAACILAAPLIHQLWDVGRVLLLVLLHLVQHDLRRGIGRQLGRVGCSGLGACGIQGMAQGAGLTVLVASIASRCGPLGFGEGFR